MFGLLVYIMESNSNNARFEVLCRIVEEWGLVTCDAVSLPDVWKDKLYVGHDWPVGCGPFSARARGVTLLCNVQTCCAVYPASHLMVTGVLSLDVKLPGREFGHLLPSSAAFKNEWNSSSATHTPWWSVQGPYYIEDADKSWHSVCRYRFLQMWFTRCPCSYSRASASRKSKVTKVRNQR